MILIDAADQNERGYLLTYLRAAGDTVDGRPEDFRRGARVVREAVRKPASWCAPATSAKRRRRGRFTLRRR